MVEKLSEPTTGYFQDGDRYGDGVAVNHQENEKSVVAKEEKPKKGRPPSSNNNKVWTISVKPFVVGGLAGLFTSANCYLPCYLVDRLAEGILGPQFKHFFRSIYPTMFTGMPSELLRFSAYSCLQLGSFEILTRNVEAHNKAMPLTLYQELCCGLASGAITACIDTSIYLARERQAFGATHSNVIQNLYHIAKWKDACRVTSCTMAMSMGRLVSYNRSYNYFRKSLGLDENEAIIGAGAVSGFCGLACYMPLSNVYGTMINMRPDASGKYPYTGFLDCAFKLWKSRGARPLYAGFPQAIAWGTPATMILWCYFEEFRKGESVG